MAGNSAYGLKQPPQLSKPWNIVLWILQVLVAGLFLMTGSLALAGAAPVVESFGKIGLGQWFRYFTGGVEALSAVLLLIPRVTAIGAALLACTMVGAIITHIFLIGGNPAAAILLLLITVLIAWKRRPLLPI
jgi:putative oxidoreductase